MNICIKKLFSQRFYDTSYWYHKSCEGVGGLILEVGTFGITFFGFAMHTHQACLNDPPPPHPHLKKLIWRLKIIQVVNLKTKNYVLVWIGGSPIIKTTCPVEMAHSAVIESS